MSLPAAIDRRDLSQEGAQAKATIDGLRGAETETEGWYRHATSSGFVTRAPSQFIAGTF